MTGSRYILEAKLARSVRYLAWPGGLYNDALVALARDAGYTALLTIDDGLNAPGDDPMRIKRTTVHGGCPENTFKQMLMDGKSRNCGT